MRRIIALLCAVSAGWLVTATAAHADSGTDFSITNAGGTTYVAPGAAGYGTAQVDIENGGSSEAGVLTLTFPTGLSLVGHNIRRSDGLDIPCQAAAQVVTCRIAASLMGGFEIDIAAAPGSAPGPTAGVRADIEPQQSTDPDPDNNVVVLPVSVKPTARLSFQLDAPSVGLHTSTSGKATVPVDTQTAVVCTVTSHGPDDVTNLHMRFALQSQTASDWDLQLQPGGPVVHGAEVVPIGGLEPGQSHRLTVYVTAHSGAQPGYTICNLDQDNTQVLIEPNVDRAGDYGVVATLTAGGATPTSTAPSPSPSSSSSSGGSLASTGVDATGIGGLAALLLVTGAGALYLGRRRTSPHRH